VVVGRCYDGHIQVNDEDEVTQTTMSSANQEAIDDNETNLGDKVANNSVQALTQISTNVNIDNDLVIILGCQSGSIEINDSDKVTQSHFNPQTRKPIATMRKRKTTNNNHFEDAPSETDGYTPQ
jgi:hypothetical protein